MATASPEVTVLLAAALIAAVSLFGAFHFRRKRRLLADLPTCKTQGVFIGFVELEGTAESNRPLTSHLAGIPCVSFSWTVEEHWRRGFGKNRKSGWTTVGSGGLMIPFYLRDDTGALKVIPFGAQLETKTVFDVECGPDDPLYYSKGPMEAVSGSTEDRRFVEQALPLHTPLYVVGVAREREDVVAPEIAEDPAAPVFLISTRSERSVRSGFLWMALACEFLALAALGVGLWMAFNADPRGGAPPAGAIAATAGGFVLAWMAGWTWMAYNALVNLRQRLQQAWSLVDVQLKRRNDLIPNLVEAVKGHRDFESAVQTELAALRAQLGATPPGQPGPDPAACARTIAMIAERYPDLKASKAFLSLQEEIGDTESRIALARAYFNDIATFYNTRLEIVPDRLVAGLAGLQPRKLMESAGFERAPVAVDLID